MVGDAAVVLGAGLGPGAAALERGDGVLEMLPLLAQAGGEMGVEGLAGGELRLERPDLAGDGLGAAATLLGPGGEVAGLASGPGGELEMAVAGIGEGGGDGVGLVGHDVEGGLVGGGLLGMAGAGLLGGGVARDAAGLGAAVDEGEPRRLDLVDLGGEGAGMLGHAGLEAGLDRVGRMGIGGGAGLEPGAGHGGRVLGEGRGGQARDGGDQQQRGEAAAAGGEPGVAARRGEGRGEVGRCVHAHPIGGRHPALAAKQSIARGGASDRGMDRGRAPCGLADERRPAPVAGGGTQNAGAARCGPGRGRGRVGAGSSAGAVPRLSLRCAALLPVAVSVGPAGTVPSCLEIRLRLGP